MKAKLKQLLTAIAAWIVYWLIAGLRLTWTMKENPLPPEAIKRHQNGKIVVFAHFHEDDWPMIVFYFRRPMIVLISLSKDGSLLTQLLELIGFKVARGSSSRGAVRGFRKLLELCRTSGVLNVSLAVDGPRGPRREFKKGILRLAYFLESPIFFASSQVDRAWIANSWARTVIPKPFAKMELSYQEILTFQELRSFVEARNEGAALELMKTRIAKQSSTANTLA